VAVVILTTWSDTLLLRWVTVSGHADQPANHANSALYPQRDGKLVPANVHGGGVRGQEDNGSHTLQLRARWPKEGT